MGFGLARTRDQRVADQANAADGSMCGAHGCPNRWSVDSEVVRKACSAHAWADPREWPRITEEQQQALAYRRPARPPDGVRLTADDRRAIVLRLQQAVERMRLKAPR